MFCFYKPGKLWKIVVLVAGFIEIKNARVKKFSNIRKFTTYFKWNASFDCACFNREYTLQKIKWILKLDLK